ncbi:type II toxin-antitoxin system RelE/ParE family toxin [Gallibacterium anatis]|uniref:type II toxin-antitoxin system RelE/ParE family toxin n=1 Tax=Gallibacterium anatis TaxID=750 RepID=UPI0022A87B35|nr:type II toxin-antitoxin system RelE/ParE family toxin [Gallibacterium anatis]
MQNKSYFVAGISKNDRENISSQELAALKALAREYTRLTAKQIEAQIENGLFIEILPEAEDE